MAEKQEEIELLKMDACGETETEIEAAVSKAISFKDQRKILKSIENQKYLEFFWFSTCTGMRVCESLSIKCSDINKRKKVIHIRLPDTKTKKHTRSVPFLPELFDNMDLKREYLFEDITDEGSKQYYNKFYKDMGMELSRHSTRHTFISICAHIGISAEVIQKLVGHTDIKMTIDTYTHAMEKGSSKILDYIRALKKTLKNHIFLNKTKEKTKKL